MKRLSVLCVLLAAVVYAQEGRMQTYHITGPELRKSSITVRATSRLDALASLSMTVWTESEWKQCRVCGKGMPAPVKLKVLAADGKLLLDCDTSETEAKNCHLQDGAALDEVMTIIYKDKQASR